MRWKKIRIKGLGPFRDEVELDLEALSGDIVAITGENGSGKTTLLELLIAALDRHCSSRGPIVDLSSSRGAFFETDIEFRGAHRIRHIVDGISRSSEALILDSTGRPELKTTKVSKFKKWISANFPDTSVLYNGQFAAQGQKGLLGLKPGPRKSVILEALGCSELEDMATRAAQNGRLSLKDLEALNGRLSDERRRGGGLETAQAALETSIESESRAEYELEQSTIALESAQKALDLSISEARDSERRRDLGNDLGELRITRAGISDRLQKNRGILERRSEVDGAVERASELQAAASELEREVSGIRESIAAKKAEIGAGRSAQSTAESRLRSVGNLIDDEVDILASMPDCRAAAESLEGLRADAGELETRLEAAKSGYDIERALLIGGMADRIENLRRGLHRIKNGGFRPALRAAATLDLDDKFAKIILDAPATAAAHKSEIDGIEPELVEARAAVADADRKSSRLEAMDSARGRLQAAERESDELNLSIDERKKAVQALEVEVSELGAQVERLQARAAEIAGERRSVDTTASLKAHLDNAETRIGELEPQLSSIDEDIRKIDRELFAIPVPEIEPHSRAVERNRSAVERLTGSAADAGRRIEKARVALALAREAVERAAESRERQSELELQAAAVEQSSTDWKRLSIDLGKKGLQAFEIDCAGPELTSIANDLLHNCYGPRFTVSVETTRLDSTGKKELEGCEIRVIDSESGRDAAGETFSGGEQVIIDLPLRLALAAVANDRAQSECRPTLVFDESAAAVSKKNAPAYMAMLRRAASTIDADKILIVTHAPWIETLADSVVRIKNRRIDVIR